METKELYELDQQEQLISQLQIIPRLQKWFDCKVHDF